MLINSTNFTSHHVGTQISITHQTYSCLLCHNLAINQTTLSFEIHNLFLGLLYTYWEHINN